MEGQTVTYTVEHRYIDQDASVSVTRRDGFATVRCSTSGSLPIRFPGKLQISRSATYSVSVRIDGDGGGRPWRTETRSLPLTVEIKTPDGQPFTADHVTLDDLRRFRDLRGTSQGSWTFSIHGKSAPIAIDEQETRVSAGKGHVRIALGETVASQSAPPLVNAMLPASSHRRFSFDLFRVGTFTATATAKSRVMKLLDPKGVVVATSRNGHLAHPITLGTLGKSRDAEGKPRPWSLEVLPSPPASAGDDTMVWASVIDAARIRTRVLQDRIDFLIGEGGSKLSIYGEMRGSDLLARLKILDVFSAETIDMHGLLDSVIKSEPQDEGVDTNIAKDVAYTLASHSRDFGELHVSLNEMKISAINIAVGASENIQPAIPALRIEVHVEGDATVKVGGFPLATLKIRDNRIRLEAGVRLDANGSFSAVTWIEKERLDIDVHWAAAVAAGVISAGLLTLGAAWVAEVFETFVNVQVAGRFHSVLAGMMDRAPQVLAVILGGDFTYRSLHLDGDDVVFDYIAPLEPEPKPTPSKGYVAGIGRSVIESGDHNWIFRPLTLGDTWDSRNLNKVDHIVVVMMENRSFDHVLGHRARLPDGQGSDGLTPDLTSFLESEGFPVGKLNESGIAANDLGFKTQFPVGVGHKLADVIQQLGVQIALSGRSINSPSGFVENFKRRAETRPELTPEDVLGYYEGDDLPFFKFLAENYSYCERYFSSHAGPTLPNRMLFFTGDIQYDRTGEAILDNNNGDNFSLSRAPTIFDLLTRKGVGWRVYESEPSVTMLRMFARYATDNTNIVPISRLRQDLAQGNLPAVTIVDPAMHHYPPNDDHPVADMYHGQLFLKGIYDILRSNEALWRKTMLVITYDEHGGFYDHVVPPMAEARQRPRVATENPNTPRNGHFTPSPLTTNYGLRVPTFVVSPWSPVGKGPDIVLDHCSILKTIVARFCGQDKPFVSDRVNASRSFDAYLSEAEPRMNVPNSPTMSPLPVEPRQGGRSIDTDPVSRKQMRSGNVDYHDLTGMLARMLGR